MVACLLLATLSLATASEHENLLRFDVEGLRNRSSTKATSAWAWTKARSDVRGYIAQVPAAVQPVAAQPVAAQPAAVQPFAAQPAVVQPAAVTPPATQVAPVLPAAPQPGAVPSSVTAPPPVPVAVSKADCEQELTTTKVLNVAKKQAGELEKKTEEEMHEANELQSQVFKAQAAEKEELASSSEAVAASLESDRKADEVKQEERETQEKEMEVAEKEQEEASATTPVEKETKQAEVQAAQREAKEEAVEVQIEKETQEKKKNDKVISKMKAKVKHIEVKIEKSEVESTQKIIYATRLLTEPAVSDKVVAEVDTLKSKIGFLAPEKQAEVGREISRVEQTIKTAKKQKAKAEAIEASARSTMRDVEAKASVEGAAQEIMKNFGSVEDLKKSIQKCQACPNAPVTGPVQPAIVQPTSPVATAAR